MSKRDARGRAETEHAEAIRRILLRAATEAHDDAGLSGLCAGGRWELALDALRSVDLGPSGDAGDLGSPASVTAADDPSDEVSWAAYHEDASG